MASSGSVSSSSSYGRNITFNWSTQSRDIANNTTTISWNLVGGGSAGGYVICGNFYVQIDGSAEYSSSTRVHVYQGTTIASGTKTIKHNNDGSKSFRVYIEAGIYAYAVNCSGENTFTLDSIPRASSFGTINGSTIGSNITVNINRHSNSFTHQLWYKMGSSQWYDCGNNIGASITITPTMDLCRQIPNNTSGILELCLRTFSGSTHIGDDVYKNITVYVPGSVAPTMDDPTATIINSKLPAGWNMCLQGYSQVKINANNIQGAYGSTIKSYSVRGPGIINGAVLPTTSAVLTDSGSLLYVVTVTDSRGRTVTKNVHVNVEAYTPPSLSVEAVRCRAKNPNLAPGQQDEMIYDASGTDLRLNVKVSIASCGYKNKIEKSYAECNAKTLIDFNTSTPVRFECGLKPTSSYTLKVYVIDSLGNQSPTISVDIPTDVRVMNINPEKNCIAFGGFAKKNNAVESYWPLTVHNEIISNGLSVLGPVSNWGSWCGNIVGSYNEFGYIRLVRIVTGNVLCDVPIQIEFGHHYDAYVRTILLCFNREPSSDPDISIFQSNYSGVYIIKTAAETWDIYVEKAMREDTMTILDIKADFQTFKKIQLLNGFLTELPSGARQATTYQSPSVATLLRSYNKETVEKIWEGSAHTGNIQVSPETLKKFRYYLVYVGNASGLWTTYLMYPAFGTDASFRPYGTDGSNPNYHLIYSTNGYIDVNGVINLKGAWALKLSAGAPISVEAIQFKRIYGVY